MKNKIRTNSKYQYFFVSTETRFRTISCYGCLPVVYYKTFIGKFSLRPSLRGSCLRSVLHLKYVHISELVYFKNSY